MKFRAHLNLALAGGALAAALALVPGISTAGGIEGAWDKFHNSQLGVGGSAPASPGIVGAWDQFHGAHLGIQDASAGSAVAGGSLENPWEKFHNSHLGSTGSRG
jgi:hypothetical protein